MKLMNCQVCGGSKFKIIYQSRAYKIRQCTKCGFGRLGDVPDEDQLSQIYQGGYHQAISQADYQADAKKKFELVKTYLSKNYSLLDYGCGQGYFLSLAKKAGGKVWGYDISRAAAKVARRKFRVRVKTAAVSQNLFAKDSFDAIVAFDVIEHLADFAKVLKLWQKWLKPEGYVFLTTPDLDSWDAKLLKSRWYGFAKADNHEHVNYFSRTAIKLAFKQAGFKLIRLQTWGFVRSLNYLLSQLLKRKVDLLPGQVYVPMTDMMVVARKVSGRLK